MFALQRDTGSQVPENTVLSGRRFTSLGGRERIFNCKLPKVTTLRGISRDQLPTTRFWLEQTVNSSDINRL